MSSPRDTIDYDEVVSSLLEIENVSIRFPPYEGRAAVRELNLSVGEGEVVGLVGESGSGKSVTALAILRLLDSSARVDGAIRFDGNDLLTIDDESMRRLRGREIAMIFQEPMTALNPVMPIGEQIAEAVRTQDSRVSRKDCRHRVLEAMEQVALPEPERRYGDYPHQFSGGQRQRILIAMAIVNRPRLLIADEPTTALDVTVQAQILDLLADLRRRFGLAMLFISHDLAVVSQLADRVAVMRQGLLLEEGIRAAIFSGARHPYTRSLLGAVPTMETDRHKPLASVPAIGDSDTLPLTQVSAGHWVRQDALADSH
jgi:peptide/nickel transport system ATP-binding protein